MTLDRNIQPGVEELKELTPLPIRHIVLPNGIPVSIIDTEEQKVTRIDFMFTGGIWTQQKVLQARFANEMLREGTHRFTSAIIAEKFDYYGAVLDLSLLPNCSCVTAYTLNKYFDQTADLLQDILLDPIFPEDEMNTLLQQRLQTYRIESTKVKILAGREMRLALYGEHHPIGKPTREEDFQQLTTEDVRTYYKKHYNSSNCTIILSGRVTDSIIKTVERTFGAQPFGNRQEKITLGTFPIETTKEKRVFIERDDVHQSSVRLGMFTIDQQHPDYPKLNVLNTILGGYFGSRLMSNIREDKGYTYGIYSGFLHMPDSSNLMIMCETSNEYVQPLIDEIYHEIDRLQNELIEEKELNIVRSYMIGSICRSMEISFNAAEVYQLLLINHLTEDFPNKKLEAIKTVTVQELRELACRHLCKENLKEVIAGKKIL